jgi:hypothetical protein
MQGPRLRIVPLLLAAVLGGCSLIVEGQSAVPSPGLLGDRTALQPIGPVVEIGHGVGVRGPWRYSMYRSHMGLCTRLDGPAFGADGTVGCGGSFRLEPWEALGLLGITSASGEQWAIEGMVKDGVAEVWIELARGDPVRVRPLMSLRPVGMTGQIFYIELPWEPRPTKAVAIGEDGTRLGEVPID